VYISRYPAGVQAALELRPRGLKQARTQAPVHALGAASGG
jgi:hypothetical protein